MQAGVSLGPQFSLIQKLQDACSMLKWCIKAISFSSNFPTCKGGQSLTKNENPDVAIWKEIAEDVHKDAAYEELSDPTKDMINY
ncbi:hypothetical protein ACS0TY_036035 [Phlomoides rotata]